RRAGDQGRSALTPPEHRYRRGLATGSREGPGQALQRRLHLLAPPRRFDLGEERAGAIEQPPPVARVGGGAAEQQQEPGQLEALAALEQQPQSGAPGLERTIAIAGRPGDLARDAVCDRVLEPVLDALRQHARVLART